MDVLLRQKDGSLVRADIPAEQVREGYLGGHVLFHHPDQKVPVRAPDGSVGSIPASSASHAFRSGYEPVSDEEFHKAYLDNTYGGTGAGVEAAAAGFARGLSARLSDAVIVKGAKYYGGSTYANEVRKRLGELQEARPYVSGISEGAGVLTGALATGGDNAAAEAGVGGALEQAAGQVAEREALPAAADAARAEASVSPVAKATSLGERAATPLDAASVAPPPEPPPAFDKPSIADHVTSNLDKIRANRAAADEMDMAAKANGLPVDPGVPAGPEPVPAGEVPTPPPGVNPPQWAESVQRPASMAQAAEHIASRLAPNEPSLTRRILANSPTGLITRAGRAVEDMAQGAVEELFGRDVADSATGRILTSAIKYGASGALENGLYQMGNEVDESVLGDTDLAGEKLLAAFGHEALMGSAFGLGLGGGGAIAREIGTSVLQKVAPSLYNLSRLQAFRAFGGVGSQRSVAKEILRAGLAKEGEDAVQGIYRVGDTALRYHLLDHAPDMETLFGRTEDAATSVGRKLGDMVEGIDAQATRGDLPTVDRVERRIINTDSDRIQMLHQNREAVGNLLGNNAEELKRLDELKTTIGDLRGRWEAEDDAFQKLDQKAKSITGAPEARAEARAAANAQRNIRNSVHSDLIAALREQQSLRALKDNSYLTQLMTGLKRAAGEDGRLSLGELRKYRVFLDDMVKNWARDAHGPMENARQILIKHMRGVIEDEIVDSADKIAAKAGKQFSAEYRPLKEDYRMLRFLHKKAETSLAAKLSNQHLSLTGKLAAFSVFAHGGVHGIPAAVATAAMHKIIRERGTAASALILDKLNQFAFIQRNIAKVDKAMDSAAESVVARASGKEGRRLSPRGIRIKGLKGPEETESPVETRDAKVANMTRVSEMAATPTVKAEHLNAALGGAHTNAPQTAGSMASAANSATQYLLSVLPQRAAQFDDITGPKVGRISDMELDKFHHQYEGASDFHKLMNKISAGRATRDHIEAFQKTKPMMATEFRAILAKKIAEMKPEEREAMPYQSQMQLWTLCGIPVSWSQSPNAIKILQEQDIQVTQSDGRPMNAVEPKPGRAAPTRFKGAIAKQTELRTDTLGSGELGK